MPLYPSHPSDGFDPSSPATVFPVGLCSLQPLGLHGTSLRGSCKESAFPNHDWRAHGWCGSPLTWNRDVWLHLLTRSRITHFLPSDHWFKAQLHLTQLPNHCQQQAKTHPPKSQSGWKWKILYIVTGRESGLCHSLAWQRLGGQVEALISHPPWPL